MPHSFAISDIMRKLLQTASQSLSENSETLPGQTPVRMKLSVNCLKSVCFKSSMACANHSFFHGIGEKIVLWRQVISLPSHIAFAITWMPRPWYGVRASISWTCSRRYLVSGEFHENSISFGTDGSHSSAQAMAHTDNMHNTVFFIISRTTNH